MADAANAAAYYRRNRDYLAPWEPLHDAEFYSTRGQKRLIRADRRGLSHGTGLRLWIYRAEAEEPNDPIGNLAVTNIVRGPFLSCFLGYRLDQGQVGKGYMTEAVRLMVTVAFTQLGLHRIEANVMPGNAASIRVLEKCGFTREGMSRSYLRIAGRWEDHYHYTVVNDKLR